MRERTLRTTGDIVSIKSQDVPWFDSPLTFLSTYIPDDNVADEEPESAWIAFYKELLYSSGASIVPRLEFERHQANFDRNLYFADDLEEEIAEPANGREEYTGAMDLIMKPNDLSPHSTWSHSEHVWNYDFKQSIHTSVDEPKKEDPTGFGADFPGDILDVDSLGSPEQKFAYRIVSDHYDRSNRGQKVTPLRMFLLGTEGTGKTTPIMVIRKKLGIAHHAAAATGTAGLIISAGTVHSLLNLPGGRTPEADLIDDPLARLQGVWRGPERVCRAYLIIDEFSSFQFVW